MVGNREKNYTEERKNKKVNIVKKFGHSILKRDMEGKTKTKRAESLPCVFILDIEHTYNLKMRRMPLKKEGQFVVNECPQSHKVCPHAGRGAMYPRRVSFFTAAFL